MLSSRVLSNQLFARGVHKAQDIRGSSPGNMGSLKVFQSISQASVFETPLDPLLSFGIEHKETSLSQYCFQSIHHFVEAAGRSLLLSEFHNAQIRLSAMFKNRIQVCVEMNGFEVQVCLHVSNAKIQLLVEQYSQFDASTRPRTTSPPALL